MEFRSLLLRAYVTPRLSKSKKNILCLSRPIFDRDIEALANSNSAFNFVAFSFHWSRFYPFRRDSWYRNLEQTTFFIGEEKTEELFAEQTDSLERALRDVLKRGLISGIMSANYNYFQDEPFLQIARRYDLPFFVLLKEHPYSSKLRQVRALKLAKNPFPNRGHIGLFAGKRSMVFTDFGIFDPKKSFITGFPRHEILRGSGKKVRQSDPVLLVDFFHGDLYPKEDFFPVVEMLIQLRSETGRKFKVKCKDSTTAKSMRNELRKRFPKANVSVSWKSIDTEVVRASAVVLADSTTIYDSLLTLAPIHFLHPGKGLIEIEPSVAGGIFSFSSTPGLRQQLEVDWVPQPTEKVRQIRDEILSESFQLSEGGASARVCQVIEQVLMS